MQTAATFQEMSLEERSAKHASAGGLVLWLQSVSVSVCCRNSQLISLGSSTFEIGSTWPGRVGRHWLVGPMLSRVRDNQNGVSPFPVLVIPAAPAKTPTALSIGLTLLTGFVEAALLSGPTWAALAVPAALAELDEIKIASYLGKRRVFQLPRSPVTTCEALTK